MKFAVWQHKIVVVICVHVWIRLIKSKVVEGVVYEDKEYFDNRFHCIGSSFMPCLDDKFDFK